MAVIVDGDAGQGRQRLPLRTRRDAQDVLGRVALHVRVAEQHPGRDPQQAEPLGDLGGLDDAAPAERDLPAELVGEIDHDLHPEDARREHRDDDLAARAGEDLFEGVDHLGLGAGKPPPVDVGAVGEQRQHAALAEFAEPVQVKALAVDRGLVDLEVAGVDDGAGRRLDRQRHAVWDGMRDAHELDGERAHLDTVSWRHPPQPVAMGDPVLLELGLDKRQGERGPVDRSVYQGPDIRHGPDVVLVAVRQHEGGHAAARGRQSAEVRDDEVDTGQLGLGKHHAGVHEDRRVAPGHQHHVHAELAEPSERHDFQGRAGGIGLGRGERHGCGTVRCERSDRHARASQRAHASDVLRHSGADTPTLRSGCPVNTM